ncbi:filamentous hemagglutinin family protein, partial [Paraburkholderia tropica]|nr:filamentous hemagglutinin family protein [Paraburkholderia tropica]
MLVAVEETATGAGKKSGQTRANRARRRVVFTLRQLAFAALALAMPALSSAQIAGGGGHAPSVIQTPNGIEQVNINRPSGAGVSVNTYNRFDVQQRGAILNNSPTMVQSQLGGMINGNPNFAPGQAAKVIVNQVNSASASQFNGALEVAGQRANVILANPSGISVNGGTFINTSRATLTTGTPNYAADGSLSGFNVTGGNITVSGAGLNASGVDQVDLLARAVQANAAVYAKNLNVVTLSGNTNTYYQNIAGVNETFVSSGNSQTAALRIARVLSRGQNDVLGGYVQLSKRFGDSFIDDTTIPTQARNNTFLELGATDRHYFGAAQFDGTLAYRQGIGGLGATPDPYIDGPTYRFHMAVL